MSTKDITHTIRFIGQDIYTLLDSFVEGFVEQQDDSCGVSLVDNSTGEKITSPASIAGRLCPDWRYAFKDFIKEKAIDNPDEL